MANWLKVEPKVVNDIRRSQSDLKKTDGVTIELTVSPYDIPNFVRGSYDKFKKKFVIEFKYMQDEPTQLIHSGSHVDARVGKNSERLYGFEIDTNSLKADEVVLRVRAREEVNEAIESLEESDGRHRRRKHDNYQAVRSILQKKPDIFTSLEFESA